MRVRSAPWRGVQNRSGPELTPDTALGQIQGTSCPNKTQLKVMESETDPEMSRMVGLAENSNIMTTVELKDEKEGRMDKRFD